jgi:hypothetical protein
MANLFDKHDKIQIANHRISPPGSHGTFTMRTGDSTPLAFGRNAINPGVWGFGPANSSCEPKNLGKVSAFRQIPTE